MTTIIHSNGSKWAGEQPDSIETLLEVLGKYVLHRIFEIEGETTPFIEHEPTTGITRFFGNFQHLSHVFSIDSDDPEVVGKMTTAIAANVARPDYQSQPTPKQRREAREAERRERDARRRIEQERHARRVLGL